MNKKNFVLVLSFILLIYPDGFCSQKDSFIGMGVMYQQSPYTKVDSKIYPVPIISLEYKRFFIDQTLFGFHLIDTNKFKFSFINSVRLAGYNSDDSPNLNGMQDRKSTLEAGLRVKWNSNPFTFTITGLTDLLDKHEGQQISVFILKEFFERFLTLHIGISWFSDNLVNYYYGVKDSEVTSQRSVYQPDDTVNYITGLTFAVPLGRHWTLINDIQYELLGEEIKYSPLVDKNGISRFIFGIVYRF
ncbi:MAG: MipA/OmpV family protein [Candidatus Omnitrophica bacterium]|nr:MipA/OmpV family protein [Candidatus Omnitrophota bacterium]